MRNCTVEVFIERVNRLSPFLPPSLSYYGYVLPDINPNKKACFQAGGQSPVSKEDKSTEGAGLGQAAAGQSQLERKGEA